MHAQNSSQTAQILIIIPERHDQPTVKSITDEVLRAATHQPDLSAGQLDADMMQDGDASFVRYTRVQW